MQLNAIHVISWLQIFCCSAAFLSGSAAKIFVEIMVISKKKPCRGEIFVNILYIPVFKQLDFFYRTPMNKNLKLYI